MSFFKDFKEDLSQAVNELMPEEEAAASQAAPAEEEESPTQSDNYSDLFAKFEDDASPAESESAPEEESEDEYEEVVEEIVEEVEVDEDYDGDEEEVIEEVVYVDEDGNPIELEEGEEVEIIEEEDDGFGDLEVAQEEEGASYAETMSALSGSAEPEEDPVFSEGPINTVQNGIFNEPEPQSAPINTIWSDSSKTDAGTIIRGMTVTGNISSDGSLDVHGAVDGNIEIDGKLSVTGKIEGDSKADEIFINGAKIIGGLFSNNSVKVAGGSVIKGNIKASAAVVAGAVKGDIDVQGPVILDATAVIVGNIKSKSIQINNGAIIEGSCSQCYSDVTANNYFDEEE